jgi:hypothetical protein
MTVPHLPSANVAPLHPRHGIHDPGSGTPDRVPGSARRTTSIDMLRPDGLRGRLVLVGRGRDLWTAADGSAHVLRTAGFEAEVDFTGDWSLRALRTDPDRPALAAVLGSNAGSGLRGRIAAADPGLTAASGLLLQLLDDIPVTTLVSGLAFAAGTRALEGQAPGPPEGRSLFGRDMCAGFADGGTIMAELDAGNHPPLPTGPRAGDLLTEDPLAWHDLPPLDRHATRRVRRIDVVPGAEIRVDVLFRDSYVREDGVETAIHEYDVVLTGADGAITAITATPRALPWVECPVAAASADRLVGVRFDGLRAHVRHTFGGTSTCTHLNDTLRSLEAVPELLDLL